MKITIEINGQELELSHDAAKKIHAELSELFGTPKEVITVPAPYPVYERTPWDSQPIYWHPRPWVTIC